MKILEDLINNAPVPEVTEASQVLETILAHPLVSRVSATSDTLYVYTHPILLKNPYGEGTLNLGSLIIQLHYSGSFTVHRNTELSDRVTGRSPYLNNLVHPHVSRYGNDVCLGNTSNTFRQFHRERNIPMFVTFMLEFLQTYDNGSPYWRPWFKEPCNECGHNNTDTCKWCVCASCSAKNDGRCGGCARWKQQSAGAACAYIKTYLDTRISNMDEDDFIAAVREIEVIFK